MVCGCTAHQKMNLLRSNQFEEEEQVKAYSSFRPSPPPELIRLILEYLGQEIPGPFVLAVDAGCGSGQSSLVLVPHFQQVLGFDVSEAQVKEASLSRKAANIKYGVAPAENLPVPNHSVQLLTASTCFHWLDEEKFFREAKRVLAPGGVLAAYSSCAIYPQTGECRVDRMLQQLTDKILYEDMANYRSPYAKKLFTRYGTTYFPFDDVIRIRNISQVYQSRASDAAGYIRSMSTFQNYRNVHPKEADYLLEKYQNSIMEILGIKSSPETVPMSYRRDYFLILCRYRS